MFPVTVLEVVVPLRVEWVGRPFDLDMSLLFYLFCYFDQAVARSRIGEVPTTSIVMQKVAFGDPASGFIRVAALAPSVDSSPHKAVDLGKHLGADNVPMVVGPASEYGVEFVDELIRRSPFVAFTNGSYLLLDTLETGLAGRDLQFCRFPVGPGMFPDSLSQKVKTFVDRGDFGLFFGEADPSYRKKCLQFGNEVFQRFPVVGGDDEIIRVSDEVDVMASTEALRLPLHQWLHAI